MQGRTRGSASAEWDIMEVRPGVSREQQRAREAGAEHMIGGEAQRAWRSGVADFPAILRNFTLSGSGLLEGEVEEWRT